MSVPLQVISINKAEYGFVYTYMGSGIYKCRRCSEWGDKDSEVLWLMKGGNNVWYAFDAPKDPLPTSVPTDDKVILKSYPEFDALLPGIHKWTAMRAPGGPRLVIYETFLIDDMQRIMESDVRQHRAVAVQGKRNQRHYDTVHVMGHVGASTIMQARQGIRFMDWSKCHHLISSTSGFIQGSLYPAPTCSMKLF